MQNKLERYDSLVKTIKNCPFKNVCNNNENDKETKVSPCKKEFFNEVNLWTYWEGGRQNLNAKILLLGQDWGCCQGSEAIAIDNIRRKLNGENVHYLNENDNPTNRNLVSLFNSIGYDIESDKPEDCKCNKALFFSNAVLCYRNKGNSVGFQPRWANNCSVYLKELIQIIEPQVILCLGKVTFNITMKALGATIPPIKSSYNSIISGVNNPYDVKIENNKEVKVFALAHCGVLGTNNRNNIKDGQVHTGLDLQLDDWKKIKNYLD